jgi:twitching motility protein PilT
MQSLQAPTAQDFIMTDWLQRAAQMKASDAHFHSSYPPLFRINGKMVRMGDEVINQQQIANQVLPLLSQHELVNFKNTKDADFVYQIDGVGRFRGSVFMTQTGLKASFRVLPLHPSPLEELGLPLSNFTTDWFWSQDRPAAVKAQLWLHWST